MTAERWKRVKPLFFEALALPAEERLAFLNQACGADSALRDELLTLLAADEQVHDEGFLNRAASDLLPDLAPNTAFEGQTIGAYTLLREIGHGGMGTVYLAVRRIPFKQYVALKLIRGGYDRQEALQRFEMERQILASLNHPNIARLLDGGTTDDDLAYFAMEYIDGERITTYCDTQRLPLPQRLSLFQDVCRAVHYAHQNLVVHRDLKPGNILVTKDGRIKLLDFGVAKLLNPHLSSVQVPITRTLFRMMTPEYASPEQVRGEALTTASDIYALGVLLYELLTGHRPHHITSSSPQEIERIVCEEDPERPSTRVAREETIAYRDGTTENITPAAISRARGTTPDRLRRRLQGDLDNMVLKAMRKEPSRRYASAEQLAADLDRYLAGAPVLARKPTMTYRMQKFVRRHRAGTAMTALLIIVLVTTGILYAAQVTAERDRAQQAAAQAEQVTDFMISVFQGSGSG